MRLEIFRSQPADKPSPHAPILFVHGAYCGAWIWAEKFMPYFAARGFSCHAVSLRGHGGSEGILTWASLEDYVSDVETAAKDLDAPVIIGHSMGGLIAQYYITTRPARGAVLLSTLPPSGLASSAMHMSMVAPDVLWQLGLLQSLGPNAISASVIHRAFFTDQTPPAEVEHLMPRLQAESHRANTELLCPSQPQPPVDGTTTPVLVVGGDADVFLPVSAFREAATYFKADLEILHGAPHGLMLDTAWWKKAADTIIAWLEKKGL